MLQEVRNLRLIFDPVFSVGFGSSSRSEVHLSIHDLPVQKYLAGSKTHSAFAFDRTAQPLEPKPRTELELDGYLCDEHE